MAAVLDSAPEAVRQAGIKAAGLGAEKLVTALNEKFGQP
jgi:hypothetical protein